MHEGRMCRNRNRSPVMTSPADAAHRARRRTFRHARAQRPAAALLGRRAGRRHALSVGPDRRRPRRQAARRHRGADQARDGQYRRVLKRAGLGYGDVFHCTAMLGDMKNWPAFNKVYVTYFPAGKLPARSAFGANGLALGALLELECQAYAGKKVRVAAAAAGGRHSASVSGERATASPVSSGHMSLHSPDECRIVTGWSSSTPRHPWSSALVKQALCVLHHRRCRDRCAYRCGYFDVIAVGVDSAT